MNKIIPMPSFRFEPGSMTLTFGVKEKLTGPGRKSGHIASILMPYITRHLCGDWGDVDDEDKRTNNRAIKQGQRIVSAYTIELPEGAVKIWIITEADRSVTTVLLPEEY